MLAQDLKVEIDAYASRLMSEARLWKLAERGAVTPRVIASYVYNLIHLVTFTEPHLTLAGIKAREIGRPELGRFFIDKMLEEEGHAEWGRSDLTSLRAAFGVERVLEPKPAIDRLIHEIERAILANPASHLGYVTFTEYFTVIAGPAWMRLLSERCGISPEMLSIVGRHVELDIEHAARGFAEISGLIQTSDGEAVFAIVRTTMRCLEDFYDELADEVSSSRRRGVIHAA